MKNPTLATEIEILETMQHRAVKFIAKLKVSVRHDLNVLYWFSNGGGEITDYLF